MLAMVCKFHKCVLSWSLEWWACTTWEKYNLTLRKCRTLKLLFPNHWRYLAPWRKSWDAASRPSPQPVPPLDRMAPICVLMPYVYVYFFPVYSLLLNFLMWTPAKGLPKTDQILSTPHNTFLDCMLDFLSSPHFGFLVIMVSVYSLSLTIFFIHQHIIPLHKKRMTQ